MRHNTKQSEKKQVAFYARVSSKSGRQETKGQLREMHTFADKQGWKIAGEYVDRWTGTTAKRPEFERLFADAAERKFDLVLFWSLDRFSREGAGRTLQHLQRLTSSGVDWWSLKEEYLRSIGPFAEAVIAILAVIAKQEHIRISERTLTGLETARAAGKQLGRPAKVVDLKQARAMRRQGRSLREIGQQLGVSAATAMKRLAV